MKPLIATLTLSGLLLLTACHNESPEGAIKVAAKHIQSGEQAKLQAVLMESALEKLSQPNSVKEMQTFLNQFKSFRLERVSSESKEGEITQHSILLTGVRKATAQEQDLLTLVVQCSVNFKKAHSLVPADTDISLENTELSLMGDDWVRPGPGHGDTDGPRDVPNPPRYPDDRDRWDDNRIPGHWGHDSDDSPPYQGGTPAKFCLISDFAKAK